MSYGQSDPLEQTAVKFEWKCDSLQLFINKNALKMSSAKCQPFCLELKVLDIGDHYTPVNKRNFFNHSSSSLIACHIIGAYNKGPLAWIHFNPSMDMYLHPI